LNRNSYARVTTNKALGNLGSRREVYILFIGEIIQKFEKS